MQVIKTHSLRWQIAALASRSGGRTLVGFWSHQETKNTPSFYSACFVCVPSSSASRIDKVTENRGTSK
jgi:hypothetical protein